MSGIRVIDRYIVSITSIQSIVSQKETPRGVSFFIPFKVVPEPARNLFEMNYPFVLKNYSIVGFP